MGYMNYGNEIKVLNKVLESLEKKQFRINKVVRSYGWDLPMDLGLYQDKMDVVFAGLETLIEDLNNLNEDELNVKL